MGTEERQSVRGKRVGPGTAERGGGSGGGNRFLAGGYADQKVGKQFKERG